MEYFIDFNGQFCNELFASLHLGVSNHLGTFEEYFSSILYCRRMAGWLTDLSLVIKFITA